MRVKAIVFAWAPIAVLVAVGTASPGAQAPAASRDEKMIAVTIDDLPVNGADPGLAGLKSMNDRLLASLKRHGVPAIGFLNESKLYRLGEVDARIALMAAWLDQGLELGNHTYSHPSFNKVGRVAFQEDLIRGETITRVLLERPGDTKLRWFRHPFLEAGPTAEERAGFEAFLSERGYRIAPVTVDAWDWYYTYRYAIAKRRADAALMERVAAAYLTHFDAELDYAEAFSKRLFGRNIRHVFLMHENELAGDHFDRVVERLKAPRLSVRHPGRRDGRSRLPPRGPIRRRRRQLVRSLGRHRGDHGHTPLAKAAGVARVPARRTGRLTIRRLREAQMGGAVPRGAENLGEYGPFACDAQDNASESASQPKESTPARVPVNLILGALLLTSSCTPSAPPSSTRSAIAQREDLAAFERDFFAADRSYSPEARVLAKTRLATLAESAGAISDARFILTLSEIAALADNGHSAILYRGGAPELRRVGIRMAPFGHDFFVLQAVADEARLLGGRLVAIDDTTIATLREVAHTLTGGIASRRDRMAPLLLESPGQLHALGLARSATKATYAFEMPDGQAREASLSVASAPGGGDDQTAEILSPDAALAGWRTLLDPAQAPWSLQEPGETMRRQDRPAQDAMVVQLRANLDGARPIAAFLQEAEAARRAAGRRNVVLDMRANGGGDLTLTREWMSDLPNHLPPAGRVVVLTSPWTFSAAISSVGYLKQAGQARVVLIGEAPGDRLRFWAEGRPTFLPHSGAMVLAATQRHDYLTGCRGYPDCHEAVATHPIAVTTLDPAISAPWTLESYSAGRDPGMEAAERVLSQPK